MNGQRRSYSQKREVSAQRRIGQSAWIFALWMGLAIALGPGMDVASGIDTYPGDTAIFQSGGTLQPNVMILFDNTDSMKDTVPTGPSYDPATSYTVTKKCNSANCVSNTVYQCTSGASDGATGCSKWTALVTNVSSVKTTCPAPAANPSAALTTTGQWNSTVHNLNSSGTCGNGSGLYALGNWINWWQVGKTMVRPKIDIAKEVASNFIRSTHGVRIGVLVLYDDLEGEGGPILKSSSGISNGYLATIKDMDATFSGTYTNREALVDAINGLAWYGDTQLAEGLFEIMRYYQGGPSINGGLTYTSPI
ncbi:MAG TPA: hypothetical protein VJM77_06190, partial [Nitrospiria bacterium]|nr:hypothetical protein [Nitrospiria bacterium]